MSQFLKKNLSRKRVIFQKNNFPSKQMEHENLFSLSAIVSENDYDIRK